MKRIFGVLTGVLIFAGVGFGSTSRGLEIIPLSDGSVFDGYTESYALVIGISQYDHWPNLRNGHRDAEEVYKSLVDLGFDAVILSDSMGKKPTRENILNELVKLQNKDKNARVLIYYAGHGHSVAIPHTDGFFKGYIVPKEGNPNNILTYISMDNIKDITEMYQAKHVMYIFDSCFSGHFVDISRASTVPTPLIQRKITAPVRQVISAGTAAQEASDGTFHSPVTEAFLDIVRRGKGDLNNDGYITGEEVAFYIRQQVEQASLGGQTPEYGKMRGFKDGDFILKSTSVSIQTPAQTPVQQPDIIKAPQEIRQIRVDIRVDYGNLSVITRNDGKLYLGKDFIADVKAGQMVSIKDVEARQHTLAMEYGSRRQREEKQVIVRKDATETVNFTWQPPPPTPPKPQQQQIANQPFFFLNVYAGFVEANFPASLHFKDISGNPNSIYFDTETIFPVIEASMDFGNRTKTGLFYRLALGFFLNGYDSFYLDVGMGYNLGRAGGWFNIGGEIDLSMGFVSYKIGTVDVDTYLGYSESYDIIASSDYFSFKFKGYIGIELTRNIGLRAYIMHNEEFYNTIEITSTDDYYGYYTSEVYAFDKDGKMQNELDKVFNLNGLGMGIEFVYAF
jgi:hypothetical protein